MKVQLVHQSFGDYVAGLSRGLSTIVDLHLTTLLSGSTAGLPAHFDLDTETVRIPRFRDPRSPLRAWRALSTIMNRPCDVIHWQAAGNPWIDIAYMVRQRRTASVVTVHDMQPHPGDSSVLPLTFWALRRVARAADQVIVHAEQVRTQAIAAGVDTDRLHVLPHGELGSLYSQAEPPTPPSTGTTILFFGRIQGYKGLPDLIEAMHAIRAAIPDATVHVAGAGRSAQADLRALQARHDWLTVEEGYVPGERVPELFASAALVVLPYREASQSGVAALAAGLGRAVVATRVGGLEEIVVDRVSGRLVPAEAPSELAEVIVELLNDDGQRHELERGALNQAATALGWPSIGRQTATIYEAAIRTRAEADA